MKTPPLTSASTAINLNYVYEDLGLAPTDTISGSRIPSLQQWGLSNKQATLICSDAPACVGFSVNPDDWALFYSERDANSSRCGTHSVHPWAKTMVAGGYHRRCGTEPWLEVEESAAACAKAVLAQPASAACSHSYFVWARDGKCACAPAESPCIEAPPSTPVGGTPAMTGTAVTASAEYAFKHRGCCASGWIGESVCVDAVVACAARCLANPNCQYFAHQPECSNAGTNCALYFAGSCSQADVNGQPNYSTYRMARAVGWLIPDKVTSLYHTTPGVGGSWRSPACNARGRGWTSYRKVRLKVDATAVTQPEIVLSESHATCGHEVHRVPPQPGVYPSVEKCVAKLLSLPASECSHKWFVFADFYDQHHGECTCVPPGATCALDGTPSVSAGGLVTRRMSSNGLVGIGYSLYQLQARPGRPSVTPTFPAEDANGALQGCWLTRHGIDGFGHQLEAMLSMMAIHGMRDRRGNRYLYDACVPFRIEFQHTTDQPDEHRMLRDFMQAGRDRFCDQHSPWRRKLYPAMIDTDIITRSPWRNPKVPGAEMVEDSTHEAKIRFVLTHNTFRDMVAGGGGPDSNSTTEGRPEPHRCKTYPDSNGPVIIMDNFELYGRRIFGQTVFQADPTLFPVDIPPSTLESLRGYFFNDQIGTGRSPVSCPMVAIHLRRGDAGRRAGNTESDVKVKTELLRLISERVPSASFRIHSDGGAAFVAAVIAGMKLDDPARVHYDPDDTPLDVLRDLVSADLAVLAGSSLSTAASELFVRGAIVELNGHEPGRQEPAHRPLGNNKTNTVEVYTTKGLLAKLRETPDAPFVARWAACHMGSLNDHVSGE